MTEYFTFFVPILHDYNVGSQLIVFIFRYIV